MNASKTDILLDISRRMLAAAACQDWDRVCELDAERARLLTGYRARDDLGQGQAHIEASLREVLDINQRLLALGIEMREQVMENAATLQRGIKAGQAYRQHE